MPPQTRIHNENLTHSQSIRPVWSPPEEAVVKTAMGRFMHVCAERYGFAANYASLHHWSVENPSEFWGEVAAFAGIQFSRPAENIFAAGENFTEARWFTGALFNYAENQLGKADDSLALIFRDERGRRSELTRAELSLRAKQLAQNLLDMGVRRGDRVAAIMPNCPEAIIVMLGVASIGAVFSSCSPDFGEQSILERFGQIEPKVLFGCDGYSYAGKQIDCRQKLAAVAKSLPSVRSTVLVPFLYDQPDGDALKGAVLFDSLLQGEGIAEFAQLPFDHPLFVMFSSGTTGKPKCIVHGAGGTLIQHLKEHVLHTDLKAGDRLFYFTTCGWMMWNWLAGALASGATLVLFDGSPFHPDPLALWRLAAEERVNVFGTSPRFLLASEKGGQLESSGVDLSSIRTVLSTGSPLAGKSYDYVRKSVGEQVQLCSISGGTDIISCFVLGNPLLPVYRGEIQAPGLGMAVEVLDASGNSVREQVGDLVCTRPFPSMPLRFWNDEDGSGYHSAYFNLFPGVWAQRDLAEITEHGGVVIHGRSDAVLNPGGVRIGTAEVCAPAVAMEAVADAIAVGQRKDGDERIVLFVVLAQGNKLDDALQSSIRTAIRSARSPRHVPAVIVEVPEIPRTVSGKAVELAVRAVIHGEDVSNVGSLANPEALQYFQNLPELA